MIYYTDGSSLNQEYGGWSVVGDNKLLASGGGYGTNNYMELMAVMQAIAIAPSGSTVLIATDSRLVIGWLSKNWKAHDRNAEIIRAIDQLRNSKKVEVVFMKVKGHSDVFGNQLADQEARKAATLFMEAENNKRYEELRGKGFEYFHDAQEKAKYNGDW